MGNIWMPGGTGADLDSVTATAADVRKGKVIVDKEGEPLTGTMAEIAAATYTPGTANQVIAANQYLTGAQTIKGDANLLASNILYGKSIFGVTGNVRKYAVKSGRATPSSSSRSAKNTGGFTDYVYTLSIPAINFTPQYITVYDFKDATFMTSAGDCHINANPIAGNYTKADNSWFTISKNGSVVPVVVNDRTYNYFVFGYY